MPDHVFFHLRLALKKTSWIFALLPALACSTPLPPLPAGGAVFIETPSTDGSDTSGSTVVINLMIWGALSSIQYAFLDAGDIQTGTPTTVTPQSVTLSASEAFTTLAKKYNYNDIGVIAYIGQAENNNGVTPLLGSPGVCGSTQSDGTITPSTASCLQGYANAILTQVTAANLSLSSKQFVGVGIESPDVLGQEVNSGGGVEAFYGTLADGLAKSGQYLFLYEPPVFASDNATPNVDIWKAIEQRDGNVVLLNYLYDLGNMPPVPIDTYKQEVQTSFNQLLSGGKFAQAGMQYMMLLAAAASNDGTWQQTSNPPPSSNSGMVISTTCGDPLTSPCVTNTYLTNDVSQSTAAFPLTGTQTDYVMIPLYMLTADKASTNYQLFDTSKFAGAVLWNFNRANTGDYPNDPTQATVQAFSTWWQQNMSAISIGPISYIQVDDDYYANVSWTLPARTSTTDSLYLCVDTNTPTSGQCWQMGEAISSSAAWGSDYPPGNYAHPNNQIKMAMGSSHTGYIVLMDSTGKNVLASASAPLQYGSPIAIAISPGSVSCVATTNGDYYANVGWTISGTPTAGSTLELYVDNPADYWQMGGVISSSAGWGKDYPGSYAYPNNQIAITPSSGSHTGYVALLDSTGTTIASANQSFSCGT